MTISREEIKKKLGETATDEQISAMLDLLHTSEKNLKDEKNNLQTQLDKLSDYDEMKQKLAEIENEKLTEQERLQKEKEEIAKNLKESRLVKNKAKVMTVLAGLDIDEELVDSLVSEDENVSINKANKLKTKIETLSSEVEKKTKENLTQLNIKPNVNEKNLDNNNGAMTFEKFRSLSQEEQNKFANEHPEEFEKL
nr:MAG TPA: hypothetical protein [Caudoviricetes sp.]